MREYVAKMRISDKLSREGVAWIDRLKSGRMTRADGEDLQRWIRDSPQHRQAFGEAVDLLQTVREAGRGLAEPEASIGKAARTRKFEPMSRRVFLGGAIAASAAGAAAIALNPPFGLWPSVDQLAADLNADYKTDIGERRRVMLDRVTIDMNTQTGLALQPTASGAGIRLIHGEAAIDTPGVPFVLQAGSGRMAANLAQFNVRFDGPQVCATCVAGELRVIHPRASVTLTAGEQISYTDGEAGKAVRSDPALITAWQRGILIFHDEPLSRVVAEVNRYRRGRIVLLDGELARRSVYATVHLDKIDAVPDQLQQFTGARIFRVGQVVFLS
jgi:transmembrane sensor